MPALVLLLLAASFIIFISIYFAPGDPLATLAGQRSMPPERMEKLQAQYHLDKPLMQRYFLWLGDVVRLDFGESISLREPVNDRIREAAPITIFLVIYAQLLVVLIGTVSGSIAACFRGWPDTVIIVATSIGVAIPNFVAAIILTMILAVNLDWFPVIGDGEYFWNRLYHLTLPAISQAIVASALLSRVARSSIRNELQNEHVQTAIARGLPAGLTFLKHVLRNASGPMLSVIGLQVPAMLAGTVVIERAFDLDGLGSLLLTGVNSSDFPIVQAVALIMVTATVVINVGVDIVLAFLDPRIRLDRRQQ